jgi:hypothetical protein
VQHASGFLDNYAVGYGKLTCLSHAMTEQREAGNRE